MMSLHKAVDAPSCAVEHAASTLWKIQGVGLILITFLCFFPGFHHLGEFLFFALLLTGVGGAWQTGRVVWVRTPLDLPLLLFAGWVLVTIPFATDPAYSFAEWRKLAAKVLIFYWTLLVLRMQPNRSVTLGVQTALVVASLVLCTLGLVDFVERGGTWKDRHVRATAPSSDYNWLSTYMVIAIPMLAVAYRLARVRWQRILCGGVIALALATQLVSYTRAGWLALVAQGLALGSFTGRRKLTLWVFGACVMIVVGLLALSQVGYQRDTLDPWTLHARLEAWKLGISEVLAHPFVGVGYGNNTFNMRFSGSLEPSNLIGLHNTFLMVAMGSGVPGLIFLVWILVGAVRSLLRGAAKVPDRETYALMIGTAVMIVGFAVRNVFDYMFAGSLAYLFWILVATGLSESLPGERARSTAFLTPKASG